MVNDLPQRKTHNVKGSTTRFVEGGITLTAQDGEVYHSGSCMIALVWDDTGDQVIRAHIRRLFDEDDILLTRDELLGYCRRIPDFGDPFKVDLGLFF